MKRFWWWLSHDKYGQRYDVSDVAFLLCVGLPMGVIFWLFIGLIVYVLASGRIS